MKTNTQENILIELNSEKEKCELDQLRELVHEFPLNDEFVGKFDSLLGNISEKIISERQKQKDLNIVLESSIDVIFRVSKTGKIVFTTQSVKELLGYEVEEVLGKSITYFLPDEHKDFGISILIKVFREKNIIKSTFIS